jgi:hypothetical protein
MLQRLIGEDIDLRTSDGPAGSMPTPGDQQVIMNPAAARATPARGGVLR